MIYNRFCGLYFRQALRKSEFGKKKIVILVTFGKVKVFCYYRVTPLERAGHFWLMRKLLLLNFYFPKPILLIPGSKQVGIQHPFFN